MHFLGEKDLFVKLITLLFLKKEKGLLAILADLFMIYEKINCFFVET
jgi:hypothetical protein